MALQISVNIEQDELTPHLAALRARAPGLLADFVLQAGVAVQQQASQNARRKTRSGKFWVEISRSVRLASLGRHAAEISSDHVAARQKQEGGPIEAKNARALTIPIPGTPAVGRRASEFSDLFELRSKRGNLLLVQKGPDGESLTPLFVLRKRTKPQAAEPWWPGEEDIRAILDAEAAFLLQELEQA